jgi:hypothetical protein
MDFKTVNTISLCLSCFVGAAQEEEVKWDRVSCNLKTVDTTKGIPNVFCGWVVG